MRKTDKKIDNKLRQVLTQLCENSLKELDGYQWISHEVNYNRFPDSLLITCMFTNKQTALIASQQSHIVKLIKQQLAVVGIDLKQPHKHIRFLPK